VAHVHVYVDPVLDGLQVAPFKQGEFEQAFVSVKRYFLDKYIRNFFHVKLLHV
jgi:hypothetical protein